MLNSSINISFPNNNFTSSNSNNSLLQSPHSSPPHSLSLQSPNSTLIIITGLQHLLLYLKQAIQTHHSSTLPLFSFTQILQPLRQQFVLTTGSIDKFVRLLQIINICISNIKTNKCITKRNLYYKLQYYYNSNYQLLSHDLAYLRYNLYHHISSNISIRNELKFVNKTENSEQNTNSKTYISGHEQMKPINNCDLNIVASSRCVIWGNVSLICDGRQIANSMNIDSNNVSSGAQIIQVPTCKSITIHTPAPCIIIIQKQSILYQLTPVFKSHNLHTQYLLITAKGYPDYTTRYILTQLLSSNPLTKVYYLGDYDVYGFDIYMCYAMGDWSIKGILEYAEIVDVGKWKNNSNSKLFDIDRIQREIGRFQKGDYAKILEIQNKLSEFNHSKHNFTYQIQNKIGYLTQYFAQFVQNGQKCELQLLHECAYNKLWVHQLIKMQSNK